MLRATVCPTSFGTTFAAMFVLVYWLREFPLSAIANGFELLHQSENDNIVLQHLSFFDPVSKLHSNLKHIENCKRMRVLFRAYVFRVHERGKIRERTA